MFFEHRELAAVMTNAPERDKLQFLSEPLITGIHSFIRWHGRDARHRYNYLYSKEELKPWVDKLQPLPQRQHL